MLTKDPKIEHKRRVAPATAKRRPRAKPPELPKLVKPDGAEPAGLPSQTSFEAITATLTANTLTAITERWLADEIARANAFARADANVLCAFNDLLLKLKRAYGHPARDAAEMFPQHAVALREMLPQHTVALRAVAGFLNRIGPTGDPAHFADQFAGLAQALQDLDDGIYALSRAKRSDETRDWLARAYVALAVKTMQQRCGYTRPEAAEWAAKKYPDLDQFITESGSSGGDRDRSMSLEKAIVSWCKGFSRSKLLSNQVAHRAYRDALDELKASKCNSDPEKYADWLLQQALRLRPERVG
jgi:hypothetical protein